MIGKAILWGMLALVFGGCVTGIVAATVVLYMGTKAGLVSEEFGLVFVNLVTLGGAVFFGIKAFVSAQNNQGKRPRLLDALIAVFVIMWIISGFFVKIGELLLK